jgi:hypothetical protein
MARSNRRHAAWPPPRRVAGERSKLCAIAPWRRKIRRLEIRALNCQRSKTFHAATRAATVVKADLPPPLRSERRRRAARRSA